MPTMTVGTPLLLLNSRTSDSGGTERLLALEDSPVVVSGIKALVFSDRATHNVPKARILDDGRFLFTVSGIAMAYAADGTLASTRTYATGGPVLLDSNYTTVFYIYEITATTLTIIEIDPTTQATILSRTITAGSAISILPIAMDSFGILYYAVNDGVNDTISTYDFNAGTPIADLAVVSGTDPTVIPVLGFALRDGTLLVRFASGRVRHIDTDWSTLRDFTLFVAPYAFAPGADDTSFWNGGSPDIVEIEVSSGTTLQTISATPITNAFGNSLDADNGLDALMIASQTLTIDSPEADGGVVVVYNPQTPQTVAPPVYDGPCDIVSPVYWTALKRPSDGKVIVSAKNRPLPDTAAYFGGPKDATVQSIGAITRAASDWFNGSWQAQMASIIFADTDYDFRGLFGGDNPSLTNGEAWIYVIDEYQRRTQNAVPRLLFRGLIYDDPLTQNLSYTINLNDIISAGYSLFKEEKPIPVRRITSILFPDAPDAIVNSSTHYGAPILYGNITSAKGAVGLINVGPMTLNGTLYPAVGLLAGHAMQEVTSAWQQQGDDTDVTELTSWGTSIWAPGQTGWSTIVPSGALYNDIGGQRFTLLPMSGTVATDFIAGKVVTVNGKGIETNADGTGTLITRLLQIYKHLLVNWIVGSYNSGAWLRPQQFSFFPGQGVVDVVDESSFDAADALSETYLPGGFLGRIAIGVGGKRESLRQLLSDANLSCNVSLGLDQYSRLFVRMLDRRRANFLGTQKAVNWRTDHLKNPPRVTARKREWLANQMVLAWNLNYGTNVWDGNDILRNNASALRVQDEIVVGRSYTMIADDATARVVAQQQLDFMATLPQVYTWAESLCGLSREMLTGVPVTDYTGSGPQGFVNRAMWIIKQVVDAKGNTVTTDAIDVDYLLDPLPATQPDVPAIPVGMLAMWGNGQIPVQFVSPLGVVIPPPPTAPRIGDTPTVFGDGGFVTLTDGSFFASGMNLTSGKSAELWGPNFNLVAEVDNIFLGSAADGLGFVYGVGGVAADQNFISKCNNAGAIVATFDLTAIQSDIISGGGVGMSMIGVNQAGTIAYVGDGTNGTKVYAWDLVGNTRLADLVTDTTRRLFITALLVLGNDDIVIGWAADSNPVALNRYSPSGTLLMSYSPPNMIAIVVGLARAHDDPASFWVGYADTTAPGVGGADTGFAQLNTATGAVIHYFTSINNGFDWTAAFVVVQKDISGLGTLHPPETGPGSAGNGPGGSALQMVTVSLPAAVEGVPYA